MMNFVYTLCSSTPGQIQYGGFKRALAKKSGDTIRDRVPILYLLFLRVPCYKFIPVIIFPFRAFEIVLV